MPPCRFEIVEKGVATFVYDIAHNPDGMEKLFDKLTRTFPCRAFSVIFSMSASKDAVTTARIIQRHTANIFPYDSGQARLLRKEQLAEILGKSMDMGLEEFVEQAEERGDVIVVTGSAYIMKELIILRRGA